MNNETEGVYDSELCVANNEAGCMNDPDTVLQPGVGRLYRYLADMYNYSQDLREHGSDGSTIQQYLMTHPY